MDFYVSRKLPAEGMALHSGLARWRWPRWFAHDGVRLDPESLEAVCAALPQYDLLEGLAPVPYLPGLRLPYFRFVGRRSPAVPRPV